MDMVIAEINNDYAYGVDMTQLGTNVDLTIPSGGHTDPAPTPPQTRELTQSPRVSDQLPLEGSIVSSPPSQPTALEPHLGLTGGQATSGRPPDENASGHGATIFQSGEPRTKVVSALLKTDEISADTPESQSCELATGDASFGGAGPAPNVTTPALSQNTPSTEKSPPLMEHRSTTVVRPSFVEGLGDAGTSDGKDLSQDGSIASSRSLPLEGPNWLRLERPSCRSRSTSDSSSSEASSFSQKST
jgi:hypothetical protein